MLLHAREGHKQCEAGGGLSCSITACFPRMDPWVSGFRFLVSGFLFPVSVWARGVTVCPFLSARGRVFDAALLCSRMS
jgi:hypothetical protein